MSQKKMFIFEKQTLNLSQPIEPLKLQDDTYIIHQKNITLLVGRRLKTKTISKELLTAPSHSHILFSQNRASLECNIFPPPLLLALHYV